MKKMKTDDLKMWSKSNFRRQKLQKHKNLDLYFEKCFSFRRIKPSDEAAAKYSPPEAYKK